MARPDLQTLLEERFGEGLEVPAALAQNDALQRIAGRASCRQFTDAAIDPQLLEALCAVALAAPSKSDLQQRDFLIVTDPGVMAELKALLHAQSWIADAPAMIVVLANNRRQRQIQSWHDQPFPNDHLDAFFNASVDAGIALAFFIAAAEAAGLGCCPISTIRNHLEPVTDLLDLPDHVFPVAGLGVGWPAETGDISPRLSGAATIHRDRFVDITRDQVEAYDDRRRAGQPGPGWSEAKARMYAEPQRMDFGKIMRKIGFHLE
ncbi:nitroreductase family protein [uncultured Roseobacter sp.]|uniref:nitroreductase family protein n=1 Tax=uncultured Roseobacter sp. TaxID=114847 RepID=UPI002606FC15|nr:nitroreductase family protein [uncultured Roseobacter sp.]